MKKEALSVLIKDIIMIVVTVAIVSLILVGLGATDFDIFLVLAFVFGGIPFGWRWSSKLFTAVSFNAFLIKVLISVVLGWLAIWIVLIGDIIRYVKACSDEKKEMN